MKLYFKKSLGLGRDKTALAGTVVDVDEATAGKLLLERANAVEKFDPTNETHKAANNKKG